MAVFLSMLLLLLLLGQQTWSIKIQKHRLQVEALLKFKSGITVDPSGVLTNWTQENAAFVCSNSTWSGITCDSGNLTVLAINLSDQMLQGTILPSSLGSISSLQVLNLSSNYLTGKIPSDLGSIAALQVLSLSLNNLTGRIPPELGQLKNLKSLALRFNQLRGGIPKQVGALKQLERLRFDNNALSGLIPKELANCTSLQVLVLQENKLTGPIPPELGELNQLVVLALANNRLSGFIPPSIVNCTSLQEIWLGVNKLKGPIPREVGLLRNLQVVHLEQNQLDGSIPLSLGNCSMLNELSLRGNSLHGQIPSSLGQLQCLQSISFSELKLSGKIPEELGNCSQLLWLDTSDCSSLDGPIPTSLFRLPLGTLDFTGLGKRNNNSGTLSPHVGNLTSLTYLNLEGGTFRGSIPKELANLTALQYLNLGRNGFNGSPASMSTFSSLKVLSLSFNNLQGEFPRLNATSIQVIDLRKNRFTGSLPAFLGEYQALRVLSLANNGFNSSLASTEWLWKLSQLQVLDLSGNQLEGTLPNDFLDKLPGFKLTPDKDAPTGDLLYQDLLLSVKGNPLQPYRYIFRTTTLLDLSANRLSGKLPASVGDLVGLRYLNLSRNSFTGEIPSSFGKITQLEQLDLSFNHLQGPIPFELTNLDSLASFNLSFNQLAGEIPSRNHFDTFDNSSFIGNPNLCGRPLSRQCPEAGSGGSTGLSRSSEGTWWEKNVSPISFALFSSVGFCSTLWLTLGWTQLQAWRALLGSSWRSNQT